MHMTAEIAPLVLHLIEQVDSTQILDVAAGYVVVGGLALWPSGSVSILTDDGPGPLVPLSTEEREELSSAVRAAIRREFERRIKDEEASCAP